MIGNHEQVTQPLPQSLSDGISQGNGLSRRCIAFPYLHITISLTSVISSIAERIPSFPTPLSFTPP